MPVATSNLLYLPMFETEEAWVTQILLLAGGVPTPTSNYPSLYDIPFEWQDNRRLFGTVRDPWSWYANLWMVLLESQEGQMLIRHLGKGDRRFHAFLVGATDVSIWGNTPRTLTDPFWDWPSGSEGLYTETILQTYGDSMALISTDNLVTELSALLGFDVSIIPRPKRERKDPFTLYNGVRQAGRMVRKADGELAKALDLKPLGGKLLLK